MNVICNHCKERFGHYNCYFFENLTHFLQPKAIFCSEVVIFGLLIASKY